LQHAGLLEDLEDDADRERQHGERRAHHVAGTASQVLPRRLARHARHESGQDERGQRDRQAHRELPAERPADADGGAIRARILHVAQPRPVPQAEAREHRGER
ncbi:MAG: hypothetical protein ACK56I_36275, partial [bacterium]